MDTVDLPASRSSVPDLAAAIGSALKRGRRACTATAAMRCAKGEDKAAAVDSRCLRSTAQAFAEWERRFRSTPLGMLLQWAERGGGGGVRQWLYCSSYLLCKMEQKLTDPVSSDEASQFVIGGGKRRRSDVC